MVRACASSVCTTEVANIANIVGANLPIRVKRINTRSDLTNGRPHVPALPSEHYRTPFRDRKELDHSIPQTAAGEPGIL